MTRPPLDAQSYSALGVKLYGSGKLEAALEAFEAALAINPVSVVDLLNRGSVLADLRRFPDAIKTLRQASRLAGPRPALAAHATRFLWSALSRYATASGIAGRAGLAFELLDEAASLVPDDIGTAAARVFSLNYLPGVSPKQIREEAQKVGQLAKRLSGPNRYVHSRKHGEGPIRVGFVSADFRRHPVARFLFPIERLDPSRFTLFAYSGTPGADDFTARFKRMLPNWREIAALSDDEVADLVAQDGVDILVDLSGFSAGGRPGLFARRPAPIQ